jgi:hypothetical protein
MMRALGSSQLNFKLLWKPFIVIVKASYPFTPGLSNPSV